MGKNTGTSVNKVLFLKCYFCIFMEDYILSMYWILSKHSPLLLPSSLLCRPYGQLHPFLTQSDLTLLCLSMTYSPILPSLLPDDSEAPLIAKTAIKHKVLQRCVNQHVVKHVDKKSCTFLSPLLLAGYSRITGSRRRWEDGIEARKGSNWTGHGKKRICHR